MNQTEKLEQILADKLVHHVMEADKCSKSEAISSMKKAMKENPKMFIGIFEAMEEYAQQALESYKDGWVSVEDEMPKTSGEIIVFENIVQLGYYNALGKSIYDNSGKKLFEVTHWQPLPQAPQTKTI